MIESIAHIAATFSIGGKCVDIRLLGSGHIHDTYRAEYSGNSKIIRAIIQRINKNVFNNPPALMENIVRVTEHIRGKLTECGYEDVARRVMTMIPTRDGAAFYQSEDGDYWRAFQFIEETRSFDTPENADKVYEAAKAFGTFVRQMNDLPGPPLHETLPDFHNGFVRLEAFEKAVTHDVRNRASRALQEIRFLREHAGLFELFSRERKTGRIPLRITHNDTKINNILFDTKTGEALCVIDLDTVMPGLIHYDFGDLVRTCISPTAEDETDLSKVAIDMSRFEALTRGYLSTTSDFLNETEHTRLVDGGKMMTLIIGTRFLTDYLNGDYYYKIQREEHNLERCRAQFKLFQLMTECEEDMCRIVDKCRR